MNKFVALLSLVCVAVAAPPPASCPRRCSQYKLPSTWNALDYWNNQEYIVVASSGTGSIYGWETDYHRCNGYFLYGTECCGSCTYANFQKIPKYTKYDAFAMVLYSWNVCSSTYDVTENLLGPAYADYSGPVYRGFYQDQFDRQYFGYKDLVDPNFMPYDYPNDIAYSLAVLDYNANSKILVLAACNNFDYLTYGNYPTVFVLAKNPRLTADEKKWVRGVLDNNSIDKRGIYFRDNYNCKARDPYNPRIYW